MALLVNNLQIEIGARVLLNGASFEIRDGEKVALVGANGAGKTTLLRAVAGEVRVAGGEVRLPQYWGWLPQDTSAKPELGHVIAYDYLLTASRLSDLSKQLEQAHEEMDKAVVNGDADILNDAVHKYSETEEAFRNGGGYELESTAERIASGVGLGDDVLLQELKSLSGGQRRRLELARLLLGGGDLLVLDEPTNHLDVEAKAFVMSFLRNTQSAVLVVSHDIELMNESIDRVFSLEAGQLDQYKGTYSQFLVKRAELAEARARADSNAQREIDRLQQTADKFRQGNATAARKRKNLEQRIERIASQRLTVMPKAKRRALKIKFPEPVRAGDVVLRSEGLAKRFDETTVFENLDFTVERGEAFIVVGPNGVGKTTLLRCVSGIYEPDDGNVKIGANVTLGFYAQEHEDITAGYSVLQLMQEAADLKATETELRAILGHFGLSGDVGDQEAVTLSGGEKTKMSLARLVAGKANVLLLDEPTNNLDVQSREALAGALQHYKGTIVLVSHDLEFVVQLNPKRAILMPTGRVVPFDESMLDLVQTVE